MSHGKVKTVSIKSDSKSGYTVINESEFDEKKHKIFIVKTVKTVKTVKKDDKPE